MEDLLKAFGCFALAGVLLAAPDWAPAVVGTEVPCSDEVECVQPEDVWCSGATPDFPSFWEAWNSLPPTCH